MHQELLSIFQLPLCVVENEINFEMAENMTEDGTERAIRVGTEANASSPSEPSVEDAPDESTDQVAEPGDTQSESADENVAALHECLQHIDEDDEDAGDANNEKVDSMLSGMSPKNVNMKGQYYGCTALHIAARRGLMRVVERLIEAKADVKAQDDYGDTPLHDACWKGHEGIVTLLLNRHASPNAYNKTKWTSLHTATDNAHADIVDILLRNGAKLNVVDTDNWTPLMLATRNKDAKIIRKLVLEPQVLHTDHQLEIDVDGNTPLMWAVTRRFTAGVHLLIRAGANCNTRSSTHETPLIAASSMGNQEIVSVLLKGNNGLGLDIDAQDDEGQTALHHAIRGSHAGVVKLLVEAENKANVWTRDIEGRSALHLASLLGDKIILETILRAELDTHNNQVTRPHQSTGTPGDGDVNPSSDGEGHHVLTPTNMQEPDPRPGQKDSAVVRTLRGLPRKPNITMKLGRLLLDLAAETSDEGLTDYVVKNMNLDEGKDSAISPSKTVNSDKDNGGFRALLTWAAGYSKRHYAAQLLIIKRQKASSKPFPAHLENWGAIEWAAWAELSKELWLLIASSPRDEDTIRALDRAKKALKTGSKVQGIRDIIEDPPFGVMQVWEDRQAFGLPTFDIKTLFKSKVEPVEEQQLGFLQHFKAVLIQFYKGQNQFATIRRDRPVRQVIYDKNPQAGPQAVMRQARDDAKRHVQEFKKIDHGTARTERPIYMESKPSFTWIHLPSTNVRITGNMHFWRFKTDLI